MAALAEVDQEFQCGQPTGTTGRPAAQLDHEQGISPEKGLVERNVGNEVARTQRQCVHCPDSRRIPGSEVGLVISVCSGGEGEGQSLRLSDVCGVSS